MAQRLADMNPEQQQNWSQRINAYVRNQAQPGHEATGHSVERLREARAEFEAIRKNIVEGERQVTAMREQALRLEGTCNACVDDIIHWESIKGIATIPIQAPAPEATASAAPSPDDAKPAADAAPQASPDVLPGLPPSSAQPAN